ncbi:MAG: carotenoid 1,2-hydratase [Candidatus Eremiobacteraeota bacterium]|nr:carotenoid 1,2-hydratase [Candidatus Eremiobacteraeota bacterium]
MSDRIRRSIAIFFGCLLLANAPQRFSIATSPYAFMFPRDHFAHDDYRTEWWYFTGHLRAPGGHRFGYELTFFRIGLEPRAPAWSRGESKWYAYQLYPAHFAISDVGGGEFVHYETIARDALGQGSASESSLDVRAGGWTLTGTPAVQTAMHLRASHGDDALDLTVRPQKPPAIHGVGGISRKGPCASCASHYYSFSRLITRGTLTRGGVRYSVSGISWMDHEFGSDELQADQSGWDWFSMQLNDGRDLMLYRLRRKDGHTTPQSSGSLIDRNGNVVHLPLRAFSISQDGRWVSPHTGAAYPSGWHIRVAGIGVELVLVPELLDQELVDSQGTTYWEGDVDVRDAATGKSIGAGYVELTGYASPVRL